MRSRITASQFIWGACLVVAFSFAGGCAGSDIEVDSFWGQGKQLTALGPNYAWMPAGDWVAKNADLDRELRQSIDMKLAGKGYRLATTNSDLSIRYRTERYVEQAEVGHQSWEEGALAIEVFDARSGKLIWRGTGKARLDYSRPPEKSRQKIQQAVNRVLEQFPTAK